MTFLAHFIVVSLYFLDSVEAVPEAEQALSTFPSFTDNPPCGDSGNSLITCILVALIFALESILCESYATGIDLIKIITCAAGLLEPPLRNLFLSVFSDVIAGVGTVSSSCPVLRSWFYDVNGTCSGISATINTFLAGLLTGNGLIHPIFTLFGSPPPDCAGPPSHSIIACLLLEFFIFLTKVPCLVDARGTNLSEFLMCIMEKFEHIPGFGSSILNGLTKAGEDVLRLCLEVDKVRTDRRNAMCSGFSNAFNDFFDGIV